MDIWCFFFCIYGLLMLNDYKVFKLNLKGFIWKVIKLVNVNKVYNCIECYWIWFFIEI